MSQYRAERLLASDRGDEHAVQYGPHKQALKGLAERLAAERREKTKDDQSQKKAGQRLGCPEVSGNVRSVRHSNSPEAAQAKLSQQITMPDVGRIFGTADELISRIMVAGRRASRNALKIARGNTSCLASAVSSNATGRFGCLEREQNHSPSS